MSLLWAGEGVLWTCSWEWFWAGRQQGHNEASLGSPDLPAEEGDAIISKALCIGVIA